MSELIGYSSDKVSLSTGGKIQQGYSLENELVLVKKPTLEIDEEGNAKVTFYKGALEITTTILKDSESFNTIVENYESLELNFK